MLSSLHHFTWSSQLPSFLHFTGGEADTVRTGGPLMVLELGGGTAVLGAPANPPTQLCHPTLPSGVHEQTHTYTWPRSAL